MIHLLVKFIWKWIKSNWNELNSSYLGRACETFSGALRRPPGKTGDELTARYRRSREPASVLGFFFPLKSSPSRWSASDFEAKFGRGSCAPSGRIPNKSFDGTLIHLFAKWTSCSVLHSSAYSEHSQRCAFFKRIFMELGRSIQKLTTLPLQSRIFGQVCGGTNGRIRLKF